MERIKNFFKNVDMGTGIPIMLLTMGVCMIVGLISAAIYENGLIQFLKVGAFIVCIILFFVVVFFIFGKIGYYIDRAMKKKVALKEKLYWENYEKERSERLRAHLFIQEESTSVSYNQSQVGDKSEDI